MRLRSSNVVFVSVLFPECRGGRALSVTGQNLNVVQQPKMSVSFEPRHTSEVRKRRYSHVSVRSPLITVKHISHKLYVSKATFFHKMNAYRASQKFKY